LGIGLIACDLPDGHRLKDVLQFPTDQRRPVKGDFAIFLQFHVTYILHRSKDVKHGPIKYPPDFPVYAVANFAFVAIVLVWAASNLLLLALQALGFGVGFHVHPLGEDRELTRLMANYPGLEMQLQFWTALETGTRSHHGGIKRFRR
jgi:hypothetical protein